MISEVIGEKAKTKTAEVLGTHKANMNRQKK
jgi:hypothetical protein